MATGPNAKDEDDDLRQWLQADPVSTSSAHDEAVLQAARDSAHRRVKRSAAPRWMALAAVLVLVFMGALWLGPATAPHSTTGPDLRASQVVLTVLAPGLTRGAAAPPAISIIPGVDSVRLSLQSPPTLDVKDTVLSLNIRSGKQVWQSPASQARAVVEEGVLMVDIPAGALLAPGQYELSVGSHSPATDSEAEYYYFEVRHE